MKRHRFLLFFLLLIAFTLCGCLSDRQEFSPEENRQAFDLFTEELFCIQAGSDSISLNYTLSQPEAYGLSADQVSLGHISLQAFQDSCIQSENILARLKQFSYRDLTSEQQLLYDSIAYTYRTDNLPDELIDEAMACYEVLSPTIGIQAQLPILLAEYNFYSIEDLDRYLLLLAEVYPYFEEILAFEKEKAAAGTFMSDAMAEEVITGMEQFIEDPDSNLLLTSFEKALEQFPELSEDEQVDYRRRNEEAVRAYVIPAYDMLIDGLRSLKGSGTNTYGLFHLNYGKEYYEATATARIGTDKTIPQLKKRLEEVLADAFAQMKTAMDRSPEAAREGLNWVHSENNPASILAELEQAVTAAFPACGDVDWEICQVDESMEEHLSPAFYLTPPVDTDEHTNSIYINFSSDYNSTSLFTTLAHEGFPGHMYQNIMARQNCPPLQLILAPGGYSEGWATYAESLAWQWLGMPDDAADILSANQIATLCIYGLADIGIHYEGWTPEEAGTFLGRYGISDPVIQQQIYNQIAWTPGNYLQYIGGYCEFLELRTLAQRLWKDDYSALEFHTFLMETGPVPFSVLTERLKVYS